jgi:hypothetical protein
VGEATRGRATAGENGPVLGQGDTHDLPADRRGQLGDRVARLQRQRGQVCSRACPINGAALPIPNFPKARGLHDTAPPWQCVLTGGDEL